MNTQKAKSIQGKAVTTKSPSKRNKSYASQDEGTKSGSQRNKSYTSQNKGIKRDSMRSKSCTSQDEGTRSDSLRSKSCTSQDEGTKCGSQRNKSYTSQNKGIKRDSMRSKSCTSQDEGARSDSMRSKSCTSQDEGIKRVSMRSKSCATQDEGIRSALVKTNIGGSHNKCTEATETFSRSTLVASQNKYIVTRSASVKSKIVSTQKECIETSSASIKGKRIDSQSEHSTTRSALMKSQTRGYHSEHTTTRSASTKSQTRSHGGDSMGAKSTTIKIIIRDLQNDTIKTQGQSTKRTTRGSPRKGTITKNIPIKRKHLGSESETNCTSTSNANNKPGRVPLENREDSRTCSVTQEHSQLEEGEIIDGGSSPHTRHPSGRKRRRRSYKARDSDPTKASVPKKFRDKVEIVYLRRKRYTLRDGKRGQKLVKHRSTGDGRQGTANTPSSIDTCSASTGMKTSKVAPGDQCAATAVALEEGEILSDSDVPGNISTSEMLPQSGSDMSISSEDSGTEESVPTTEHGDSHMFTEGKRLQVSSDVRNTTITPTAAEPQGSNLNPLAAVFIPTSGVSDLAQQSNMTGRSESSRASTHPDNQPWPTFIAQSHFTQRGSQFWPKYPTLDYLPQTRGLDSGVAHGYIPSSDPNSSFPAPDGGIFDSVSSIWSYIRCPQRWSRPVRGPFWQPSLCALPGSDWWCPMDMGGESRGQTSNKRFHLSPTAGDSCPEIRNSSRCWQTVGNTDVQAGSMEVTVMCYNILSQELMDRHMYLYNKCRGADLEWEHRGPALLTQIIAHNADIVCLQEVEQDHWMQDIRDTLGEHGYAGVYKKQSGDNTHGCAILFKTSRFQQLQAIPVEFMKGGILDRHNIGLILLLQPHRSVYGGSVQKICVATSHLLFNPRRGDVKLAQLMVLLAEIDKHAYLDDQSDNGQCMQSGHKCPCSDPSSLDQLKPSQSGHCESSPEIDKTAGSPCGPELQTSATPGSPRYCPIILCGDFNSEPFCDLYKFITTGYLKYDDCISRLLCGQEEGKWNGTDRLVDRELLPASLNICESGQYLHVLKERRDRGASQPIPKVNSGQVWHCMNFKSAYAHFVGQGHQNREISTHHNNCSCTVDFIFYSQRAAPGRRQAPGAGSESSDNPAAQPDDSLSDVQQGDRDTAAGSVDIDKDRDACPQPLELVSRYSLLTRNELTRFGYMPNSVFPSDHLCLIARFVLR